MVKTPKTPKPKLPKQKKSLGQHIKDNSRKAVASGLRKNFGILGDAVAKKYLKSPKAKTNIRVEPATNDKKINKKKVKDNSSSEAILDSGKQVAAAIEIVAGNASRNLSRVARQVDTMGNEVSKSATELNNLLDRMLYRAPSGAVTPEGKGPAYTKEKQKEPGGIDFGWWFKRLLPLAIIPVLKGIGLMSGSGGTATSRQDMLDQIDKQNQQPEAQEANRRVDAIRNWFGWSKSSPETKTEPKVTVGGNEHIIHKMKYSAQNIKFTASGKIRFDSKAAITGVSDSGGAAPTQSAGFFNRMLDKLGSGSGGAGMFNTLADKMFGIGGSYPNGKHQPGSTATGTPSVSKPDSDYSGPGEGKYDSTKAKANYMQPDQFGAPGTNLTDVVTKGGHKFRIHKESSEAFKRTIEALEDAGMPLGSVGGYSPRPGGIAGTGRMSQHSMGNAMDIGSQSARDVIRKDSRQWIENHPKEWRRILDENGMISGGDWKNPDLGHIEWSGRKPWVEEEKQKSAIKITPKQDDGPQADATGAAKFMDIPPWMNPVISEDQDDSDQMWGPKKGLGILENKAGVLPSTWGGKDWSFMRPMDRFNTHTGESRWEDRRNEANPYDDDQYSIATMEQNADARRIVPREDLDGPLPPVTALGVAAGVPNLNKMLEPPLPTPKFDEPPAASPSQSQTEKHSYMQDTQKYMSSLDHRPRQDAVQDQDFGAYTGTTSGMEDVA